MIRTIFELDKQMENKNNKENFDITFGECYIFTEYSNDPVVPLINIYKVMFHEDLTKRLFL